MHRDFQAAYDSLNNAQKTAVDTTEGPVLVIAGPGTGKTQLLALRIANILRTTDTLPSNILCLTFTESAAQNMRERLNGIIGKAAYEITISTYHAFGSDLLRSYPDFFNAAADLEPADDLAIDAIFRTIQAALPYSNPLKPDIFLRDIKTLVSESKRALLEPKDLLAIAAANQTFINDVTPLVSQLLRGMARISKSSIPLFASLAEQTAQPANEYLPSGVVPLQQLWSESLATAVAEATESGKTQPITKWKSAWLAKDEEGGFIVVGDDQNRKLRAAATIYQQYKDALAVQKLFDYDDMILQTIKGLETHADLRYTLQERYLYLLLDEYQDTNQAQARLVSLLTDNPVNEGRPNVLAVGDDDQAIYAFQGAHYSHMYNFYEQYRDVLVVPLSQNYRSHPGILQLAEGIAEQIETRLHHKFTAIDKHIVSAREIAGPLVTARFEFKTDLAEQAWVADEIKRLIGQGLPANDIAVLAPKHKYLESLVPFLQHNGVAVRYDRRENVLDDPVIAEILVMAELAEKLASQDQPGANALWPRVLSMDCWGLATSTIWQLTWRVHDDRTTWMEVLYEQAETKQIALFFMRLSQLAERTPLELMIDYLVGIEPVPVHETELPFIRSPFYGHYFGEVKADSPGGAALLQLLSNLTTLRAGLRAYKTQGNELLYLGDLMGFARANRAAGIQILNTSPYQEASDAVTLQTVYKAKGQEYAAVFVLHATDEVWGSRARSSGSRLSIPANLAYIRYAGTTEDERLRLLYVAITRAAQQLYITSHRADAAGRAANRLKYLDEHEDDDGQVVSPLMPAGSRTVQQVDTQSVPTLSDISTYWHHRHTALPEQPELKELLQPRLQNFQLSPTQLNSFVDISHGGPAQFFLRAILRFPSSPSISSSYGDAIHETLQYIHDYNKTQEKLPTMDQIEAAFALRLSRKRLDAQSHELLLERGMVALEAYMVQRSQTIRAANRSEANFRDEGVFLGKAHLTGKIDKLIIDEKQKTICIVDFKTGKSHNRWTKETKLHFYEYQLYFYKLLVERSQSYRGYRVIDAYLEFVEPDTQGNIQELHVAFNDETSKHLELLIQAVWQHTMQLDFPEPAAETFSTDLKGTLEFENWLIEQL
ncbi:MAG: uvrD [Candidatus Saccharibacteria bacterium]|nr:uvrD [Candidatus Saccharibacteria bacterium]